MNLSVLEMAALKLAGEDPEGRLVVFDPNDGPLSVISSPGFGEVELGERGLKVLVSRGLIKFDGGSSYLLTKSGWQAINKSPNQ